MKINNNTEFQSGFLRILSLIILSSLILISCEDSVPNEYIKKNFVEALLIVDEPIRNIMVMETQPLTDTFSYEKSQIRDAVVKISEGTNEMILKTASTGTEGYFYEDESYIVKPKTTYKLEIILKDGTKITGSTITPEGTQWVKLPNDIIYFPKDTVYYNTPDTIKFEWNNVPQYFYYILAMKCLDTLYYGKYLTPQTTELNRRVFNPFRDDEAYQETSSWTFIPASIDKPTSIVPVFWNAFKWFGKHEFRVYVPDYNFLRWMVQYIGKGQYDPLLSSVDNAIGVFGSASVIRDTAFIIKNQP